MMATSSSSKKAIIALVSVALGIWTGITNFEVCKDLYPPIVEACLVASKYETMKEFQAHTGLQPYNRHIGFKVLDPLVCFSTQFLHDLKTQQFPAGFLTWAMAVLIGCPAFVTLYLEAGKQQQRNGNKSISLNPLAWPTVLWILFLVMGVSVVWPLIWVPSYCFFGGNNSDDNSAEVSPFRAKMVVLASLSMPILTALVFCVLDDAQTPAWTMAAGALGGPLVCTPGLLLWWMDTKATTTTSTPTKGKVQISSAEISAIAYATSGIVSLVGYLYLVYTTLRYYGAITPSEIWTEFWAGDTAVTGHTPHPAVRFMFVDAAVFWIGYLLTVWAYDGDDFRRTAEAALLTPVFGPGAACAMAMASIEMDRLSSSSSSAQQPTKATTTTIDNKKDS